MTFTDSPIITKTIHDLEKPKKRRSRKRRKSRTRILHTMPNNHDHFTDNKNNTLFTFYCPCNYQSTYHTRTAKQSRNTFFFLLQPPAKAISFTFHLLHFSKRLLPSSALQQHSLFSTEVAQPNCRGERRASWIASSYVCYTKPIVPFERVRATTN